MQFPDARILILSKAPRPGRVKTRLIPLLGEAGACAFHRACLAHTLHRLANTGLAPAELWLDCDMDEAEVLSLVPGGSCSVHVQRPGDLGQRMVHAAASALARGGDAVILVGTDAPLLDASCLESALRLLQGDADVVMGPAEDGGYVLLGLREAHPKLFQGMPWGGDQVAHQTRVCCRTEGLALHELPMLWDVDRPRDVMRLCRETDTCLAPLQALLAQHLPRSQPASPCNCTPLRE